MGEKLLRLMKSEGMSGLFCGDFFVAVPASHLDNRMTVCMGYPAMNP